MSVRKFRTIEEMKAPVWRQPGDPALFRVMAGLWQIGARTSRRRYPPGVHKHASIEEMQNARDAWVVMQSGRRT